MLTGVSPVDIHHHTALPSYLLFAIFLLTPYLPLFAETRPFPEAKVSTVMPLPLGVLVPPLAQTGFRMQPCSQ